MKALKNTHILNLSIIIVMLVLGVVFYHTYLSYQKYITVQNSTKVSFFLEEVESVLYEMEFERIDSAAYLATPEKRSFQTLKKRRVVVDRALAGLDFFVEHNGQYTIFNTQVKLIANALKDVRKEIDNLSEDRSSLPAPLFPSVKNSTSS